MIYYLHLGVTKKSFYNKYPSIWPGTLAPSCGGTGYLSSRFSDCLAVRGSVLAEEQEVTPPPSEV